MDNTARASFWGALGAISKKDSYCIGSLEIGYSYWEIDGQGINWLDPSDPAVPLEALIDGLREKCISSHGRFCFVLNEKCLNLYDFGDTNDKWEWKYKSAAEFRAALIEAILKLMEATDGN